MLTDPWSAMTWCNEPPAWSVEAGRLRVRTAEGSDFWRETAYGFVRDSGHFLGAPVGREAGLELVFEGRWAHQFDQAGLLLRAAPDRWVKAGVELSDGRLYASVVVTAGRSDWSVAPLPDGAADRPVTVRMSRSGDAVTVRYGIDGPPDTLLRVLPIDARDDWQAGPFCASPTGPGVEVVFGPYRVGPADAALHPG